MEARLAAEPTLSGRERARACWPSRAHDDCKIQSGGRRGEEEQEEEVVLALKRTSRAPFKRPGRRKEASPGWPIAQICYLLLVLIQSNSVEGQREGGASRGLPDLASGTSDEPIVAIVGQDAFISCVAKNLQNYTLVWRYTNEVSVEPQAMSAGGKQAESESGTILTAGRQRVISDDRFSVIQSHETWLLKISNVRESDTGTYICQTNSEPRVRTMRILSVVRPSESANSDGSRDIDALGKFTKDAAETRG